MISPFDAYRDQEARDLMIAFVAEQRSTDRARAVYELRRINHIGLANVYRDALAKSGQGHRIDYDPCDVRT